MSRTERHALDELLVLDSQDGSTEAFEQLIRRWQRPLWRYARSLTSQPDAAWEVVQEAWVGIVRGIRGLRDPALFRPWAYRIVRNRAATWVEKTQRARRRESDVEPDRLSRDEGHRDGVEIRHALRRLPDDLRSVLTLHYLDELPVREISTILLIPEGTVKSRLHTARLRLREILERKRDE